MTRVLFSLFFVATLCATGRALAAGPGKVSLKGNHPTELARLGPVVHADPTMELHLTVMQNVFAQDHAERLNGKKITSSTIT